MKPVVYGKNKQTVVAYGPTDICTLEEMMISKSPVSGLWAWNRQIKCFIRFISGTRPNWEQNSPYQRYLKKKSDLWLAVVLVNFVFFYVPRNGEDFFSLGHVFDFHYRLCRFA